MNKVGQRVRKGAGLRSLFSVRRTLLAVGAATLLSSCGGRSAPPPPGTMRGVPPDLRGSRVILLPVQIVSGVPGDIYAELVFNLTDKGRDVDWVLRDEVDEVLTRSPGIESRTQGLPVGMFLQAEVERVGDPLFGQLRRMAGIVNAEAILLPVQATFEATPVDDAYAEAGVEAPAPRVRLQAALIVPRTGDVVWYGVEEGGEFGQDDPRGLASAVEELTRTLFWYIPG